MIIKTKEVAQVFYDVEYYIDEEDLSEEKIKELKRAEEIYGSHSTEYINLVQQIATMHSHDESIRSHNDPFGFEIDSVEEIIWED